MKPLPIVQGYPPPIDRDRGMTANPGPTIFLSNLPRSMPRHAWKVLYRMARVDSRERSKAFSDAMLYGTGFVKVDVNGARHVPAAEVIRDLGLVEC